MGDVLLALAAMVAALPIWYVAYRLAQWLYAPWVLDSIDWSGPLTLPPPPPPSLSEQFAMLGAVLGKAAAAYMEAASVMTRAFNEAYSQHVIYGEEGDIYGTEESDDAG